MNVGGTIRLVLIWRLCGVPAKIPEVNTSAAVRNDGGRLAKFARLILPQLRAQNYVHRIFPFTERPSRTQRTSPQVPLPSLLEPAFGVALRRPKRRRIRQSVK
ncbi:hypothetical protein PSHT_04002 [Puccinia striiformis]|uniref:Secreted protein n=1 Tax=Puccinia striiformis TaxID=27350 RepID=A0A2S4WE48_9BASI|nr:hypothetical protein PSHT_04002 [Puccinia striiformis]